MDLLVKSETPHHRMSLMRLAFLGNEYAAQGVLVCCDDPVANISGDYCDASIFQDFENSPGILLWVDCDGRGHDLC